MSDETAEETSVSPARAAEMLEAGAQIVDVRQQAELAAGRIARAVHIPLDALPSRLEEIERDRAVIFLCRSGARSAMATDAFRASGIEAYNLVGGIEAWVQVGLEVEVTEMDVTLPDSDKS